VIDFEAGDNTFTSGRSCLGAGHKKVANRIALHARRYPEDQARRDGGHQKSLAEFPELHAIPSSWFGESRQVC
jgi:hypothetical protein